MSKFYGQVEGMAKTIATRRGSQYIRTSAQSWNGSIITELMYNEKDKLMVRIEINGGSSSYGNLLFYGTFDEFREKLRKKADE